MTVIKIVAVILVILLHFATSDDLSSGDEMCSIEFLSGRVLVGLYRRSFFYFIFNNEDAYLPMQTVLTSSYFQFDDSEPLEHLPLLSINDTWVAVFYKVDDELCYDFFQLNAFGSNVDESPIGELGCLEALDVPLDSTVVFVNANLTLNIAVNQHTVDYLGEGLYTLVGQISPPTENDTWTYSDVEGEARHFTMQQLSTYHMVAQNLAIYGKESFLFARRDRYTIVYDYDLSRVLEFGLDSAEGKEELGRRKECMFAQATPDPAEPFGSVMLLPENCMVVD